MAPLKFEEKMKEKLEQRAIKPSSDSWERLTTQLDSARKQKKESKKNSMVWCRSNFCWNFDSDFNTDEPKSDFRTR